MNILYAVLYGGTIVLLMVGAQLQVLKGALVCPDWPLCFGEFLPLYMTPAYYESLHRFLAGLVLIGSAVWAWKRRSYGPRAYLPLFLVVMQSLLGLATFLYKLPTVITILHLIFSLLFLASLEGTHELKFEESLKDKWNPKLKDVTGSFLFLLLFQFILGGILRKSSLLASCESTMEFLECWQKQAQIPLAGSLALIHRTLGLVTTFTGLFVFAYLAKNLPKWKPAAYSGFFLMAVQIILGLQMGRSSARQMILFHFAIALASFCILVFLQVRLRRYEFHFFGKAVPTFYNDVLDLFSLLQTGIPATEILKKPIDINELYRIAEQYR
jgi:heme A synthase